MARYQANVRLGHKGDIIVVEVSGRNPAKVSHVANAIKKHYSDTKETTQQDNEIVVTRQWFNFLRDMFGKKEYE